MAVGSRTQDATVRDAGVPLAARYLGTRIKDGKHFMEVRIHGSAQVRRYVNPRHVDWLDGEPELKMGNKAADFA